MIVHRIDELVSKLMRSRQLELPKELSQNPTYPFMTIPSWSYYLKSPEARAERMKNLFSLLRAFCELSTVQPNVPDSELLWAKNLRDSLSSFDYRLIGFVYGDIRRTIGPVNFYSIEVELDEYLRTRESNRCEKLLLSFEHYRAIEQPWKFGSNLEECRNLANAGETLWIEFLMQSSDQERNLDK